MKPSLSQNVFLTNREFESIAGRDIIKALRALTSHEHTQQACDACHGKCCEDIGCGFYSTSFDCCPIFEYRPAKCRLFFCPQILEHESLDQETRDLLDTQVQKLSDIVKPGSAGAVFGDAPASDGNERSLTGLEVEIEAKTVVEAMERELMDLNTARDQLRALVAQYRSSI
jgi:hypothetical protein